ncbi:MAG: hypothetical protein IKV94_04960 [Clostridia bacterium]|nr:hypothetical protein [Clostridia bacterium]
MIGMNQIKKRLLYGILIGLSVGIVGIVIILIITNGTIKSYEEGTNEDFLNNYTQYVATFNRDVIQGETITADMITQARVHKNTVPANAASQGYLVGKIAKYNIPSGVTVVNSMVSDSVVTMDVRTQQVTAVLLPAKLVAGEYVDIRLQVPSGVEYIVLPQVKVIDIVGTTIWLNLSEADLLLLNSAIVDSYMIEGSKLYAVQYAEPDTQISTDAEATEQARLYIEGKIKEQIDALAEEVEVVTGVEDNGEETTDTELQVPERNIPAEDLINMISTYAIEYRYYVESYNKIESNYQPNATVMAFMQGNEYVVEQAKEKLSEEIRAGIEASIDAFEADQDEGDYSNIVSGITSSISTQQSLRGQVLSGQ